MSSTKIRSVLKKFADRKITRAAAAEELGVTVRTLNRWADKAGLERVKSNHRKQVEARQERRGYKEHLAGLVKNGLISVENAAKTAGVSPKTIEKWVEKLETTQKAAKNEQKHRKNAGKSRKTREKR
jgi:DNA-binding transcriptional MerR regulator